MSRASTMGALIKSAQGVSARTNTSVRKLRSGRKLPAWRPEYELERLSSIRARFQEKAALKRKATFPFIKLPLEIRRQIYDRLTTAPDNAALIRQLGTRTTPTGRVMGVIVFGQMRGNRIKLTKRSPRPSLNILRICRQIYHEASQSFYENNVFEVTARKQIRRRQLVFDLPLGVDKSRVRHLRVVTNAQVSLTGGVNTWTILGRFSGLRTFGMALKAYWNNPGLDPQTCMEMLDILIWIPKHVDISYGLTDDMVRAEWVPEDVLEFYVRLFAAMRGRRIDGRHGWTEDVKASYVRTLELANKRADRQS